MLLEFTKLVLLGQESELHTRTTSGTHLHNTSWLQRILTEFKAQEPSLIVLWSNLTNWTKLQFLFLSFSKIYKFYNSSKISKVFPSFSKCIKEKSNEEVSKELQEIRRSTRKLAKFSPSQDTGRATERNNWSPRSWTTNWK